MKSLKVISDVLLLRMKRTILRVMLPVVYVAVMLFGFGFTLPAGASQDAGNPVWPGEDALQRAPVLTADTVQNVVRKPVELTFAEDAAWLESIREVSVDGVAMLLGMLDGIDPGLTKKYGKIITRGADYYSQVEMSEMPDNKYIAYADDGKPLKTKAGGEGGLQLIICSDKTGKRSTNWLVSLELSNQLVSPEQVCQ